MCAAWERRRIVRTERKRSRDEESYNDIWSIYERFWIECQPENSLPSGIRLSHRMARWRPANIPYDWLFNFGAICKRLHFNYYKCLENASLCVGVCVCECEHERDGERERENLLEWRKLFRKFIGTAFACCSMRHATSAPYTVVCKTTVLNTVLTESGKYTQTHNCMHMFVCSVQTTVTLKCTKTKSLKHAPSHSSECHIKTQNYSICPSFVHERCILI